MVNIFYVYGSACSRTLIQYPFLDCLRTAINNSHSKAATSVLNVHNPMYEKHRIQIHRRWSWGTVGTSSGNSMQTPLEMLNPRHYIRSRPRVDALSSCRFCIRIYPFRCRYSNFATIPLQKQQLNDHFVRFVYWIHISDQHERISSERHRWISTKTSAASIRWHHRWDCQAPWSSLAVRVTARQLVIGVLIVRGDYVNFRIVTTCQLDVTVTLT